MEGRRSGRRENKGTFLKCCLHFSYATAQNILPRMSESYASVHSSKYHSNLVFIENVTLPYSRKILLDHRNLYSFFIFCLFVCCSFHVLLFNDFVHGVQRQKERQTKQAEEDVHTLYFLSSL